MSASQPVVVSFGPQSAGDGGSALPGPHQFGTSPCRGRRIMTPTVQSPFARIWFLSVILGLLLGACVPVHAQVIQTIAGGVNPSHSPSENACVPVQSVGAPRNRRLFCGLRPDFQSECAGTVFARGWNRHKRV